MARTAGRELAFTLIFQADFGQSINYAQAIKNFGHKVDQHFVQDTVESVLNRRQHLDEVIGQFSRGWAVDRLPRVDRAILRLATWELLDTDTPPAVVINEAVELSKEYATAKSPAFINGVLDNIRAYSQQSGPSED